MRGTGTGHTLKLVRDYVIPACAGNRGLTRAGIRTRLGHPCVCGERVRISPNKYWIFGSSLRVWGTAMLRHSFALRMRVIPACAGNRRCLRWYAIEFSCQIQTR